MQSIFLHNKLPPVSCLSNSSIYTIFLKSLRTDSHEMLSSGGPLCFHWPRILYSLLDLILFELAVASTNFRQGLTSLTENELQEFLNIMQSATLGYSRYTSTRRRMIITTAIINCCPSHENKKTSKRYSMVPFTPISCTLAAKSSALICCYRGTDLSGIYDIILVFTLIVSGISVIDGHQKYESGQMFFDNSQGITKFYIRIAAIWSHPIPAVNFQ